MGIVNNRIKKASNQETLRLLKMIYGPSVVCTDGLFHLYDKNHNEIYINKSNSELDKRALYRTLVVMDEVIVARVTNSEKVNFVVLDKASLKLIYKTDGDIYYISDKIVCDKKENEGILISHKGKVLKRLPDIICVNHIYKKQYIVKSKKMYQDKVLYYNEYKDEIVDLTDGLEYMIHIENKDETEVKVISNFGAQYIYNFAEHKCFNTFTNKVEEETELWKPV